MTQTAPETARLLAVMAALRHPETGCPWDRVQDFSAIAPYTIEEAYEVADAIARNDRAQLLDELGDLLFQVVYYARLAEERAWFDFAAVAGAITAKMIRRHPHVFAGQPSVPGAWEDAKAAERAADRHDVHSGGALAGVPQALPALTRALKLTQRAARVGFDWPDAKSVLAKLAEETAELEAERAEAKPVPARLADELGDMLFVLANLARKLDLDPETCLRQANKKFTERFNTVERRLASEGKTPSEATLPEMDAHWQAAKESARR
ncbi:MAG: nucleoside triphosphate pyrophosphohydrolase [Acetobacteraceae bacterium]